MDEVLFEQNTLKRIFYAVRRTLDKQGGFEVFANRMWRNVHLDSGLGSFDEKGKYLKFSEQEKRLLQTYTRKITGLNPANRKAVFERDFKPDQT